VEGKGILITKLPLQQSITELQHTRSYWKIKMIRHIKPCRFVDICRVSLDRAVSGSSFSTVHIYQVARRRNADVFSPE